MPFAPAFSKSTPVVMLRASPGMTGHYSVHTNADSLRIAESNIADIGRRLHDQGVLARARR
jgi:hypothetical protein